MTTQKKELLIRMQPNGRMYEIYYEGGGELPKELAGVYTTKRMARIDIANYLYKRDSNGTGKKTTRAK